MCRKCGDKATRAHIKTCSGADPEPWLKRGMMVRALEEIVHLMEKCIDHGVTDMQDDIVREAIAWELRDCMN